MSLSHACEHLQHVFPRHEKIGSSTHGDEITQSSDVHRAVLRRNSHGIAQCSATSSNKRVAFALEAVKVGTLHPGVLNEFKLTFDISVVAHEKETHVRATILESIRPTDPKNAMAIRDRQLLLRPRIHAVSRIGAANMRAERTARAVGIFAAKEKIIVRL